ncbi:restriction endonuclease subunit S [Mediterraneibacter agrestimuris]|uniref:restriction endonuclease subunit S n=1 Tax=Mediterraneibacter agrestimuris TaxID=2941333 RepID=UPI00203D32D8|nr:restriction endonuclease subunit S [Mediterraneibacter agrestimuris]
MTFNDVLEIKNGRNQRAVEDSDGRYPIYGSGGIMGYAKDYICNAETIIIGRKGSINKPIFVDEPFWNVDTAFGLEAKREVLFPRYLYYFCKHYDFQQLNKTVTIPSLTKSDLLKIEIKLPCLSDQQAIVHRLQSVEQIINLHHQQLEKLDDLIKARFVELFGDVATSNYKYETRKLGDVADVGSSHRVFTTEFVDSGIPFYRGTEIGELANGIKPTEPYYISEEHYNRLAKDDTKPQLGDLLMPSICNKGQVWMVDTNEPFYYKDGRVLCISPNRAIFDSKYLEYFMRVKTLVEYPKLGSGSTFAEFKIFLLKDIDVLIPPIELQEQFADFVKQVDKSKVVVMNISHYCVKYC